MMKPDNRYIVIMAGGVGSRFWPASTKEKPKQFLDILGVGQSLIQLTYERCAKIVSIDHIIVITNQDYVQLVRTHLPDLPEDNILAEPSMNNTAPSVAWCALHIQAKDPTATFAVLPSDHVILNVPAYISVMNKAFNFASSNEALVTIGIHPTRPDTGYGYLELAESKEGVFRVKQFKEKPDKKTAEDYISTGNYVWNAGMFVWNVDTLLTSLRELAPDIMTVLEEDINYFGTNKESNYIERVYPNTKKISIDYALMERSDKVYTLTADIGWSDLGTWNSLYVYKSEDPNDNVVIGDKVHLIHTDQTIVSSNNDRLLVINGLNDYIVVDEEKALLIYPKSREQEIKEVVKALQ